MAIILTFFELALYMMNKLLAIFQSIIHIVFSFWTRAPFVAVSGVGRNLYKVF